MAFEVLKYVRNIEDTGVFRNSFNGREILNEVHSADVARDSKSGQIGNFMK